MQSIMLVFLQPGILELLYCSLLFYVPPATMRESIILKLHFRKDNNVMLNLHPITNMSVCFDVQGNSYPIYIALDNTPYFNHNASISNYFALILQPTILNGGSQPCAFSHWQVHSYQQVTKTGDENRGLVALYNPEGDCYFIIKINASYAPEFRLSNNIEDVKSCGAFVIDSVLQNN